MNEERKVKLVLAGLILLIVVILFFARNSGESPGTITNTRLHELKMEILDWTSQHGKPPVSLDELNLPDEATVDHKGTPFVYEVTGSTVKISSLGADNKPGGFMFKADRVVTFETGQ